MPEPIFLLQCRIGSGAQPCLILRMRKQVPHHLRQERRLRAAQIEGPVSVGHPAEAVDQIEHVFNVVCRLLCLAGGQQPHIDKIGVPIIQLLKNAADARRTEWPWQSDQCTLILCRIPYRAAPVPRNICAGLFHFRAPLPMRLPEDPSARLQCRAPETSAQAAGQAEAAAPAAPCSGAERWLRGGSI